MNRLVRAERIVERKRRPDRRPEIEEWIHQLFHLILLDSLRSPLFCLVVVLDLDGERWRHFGHGRDGGLLRCRISGTRQVVAGDLALVRQRGILLLVELEVVGSGDKAPGQSRMQFLLFSPNSVRRASR